jgi:2-succinyl-5-enolpyruvyl-6-hydroxy-3-cyclohexene-1-carboxylate synthase
VSDLQSEWARLLAASLAEAGIRDVVISPGSRSTPVALAFAAEPRLATELVVDERSAAFFALGQARVAGRPSVLLCTSGSAGAHYHPAILEADRARIPLIALTADRPWALTESFANQTADQTKLFGGAVRRFFELGAPDAKSLSAVPRIAAQAVLAALHPRPGPVQLNARFEKPLEPGETAGDEPWRAELLRLRERGAPRVHLPNVEPAPAALARLEEVVRRSRRTLIVAGPWFSGNGAALARYRSAARVAVRLLDAVLLAESTSQLLHANGLGHAALGGFEHFLERALETDPPDLVIELGSPPVSCAWLGARALPRIVLADHDFFDPSSSVSEAVLGDPALSLEAVARATRGRESDTAWRDRWVARVRLAEATTSVALDGGEWVEPVIARSLIAELPEGAILMVGNSLPVRDLDAFGGRAPNALHVLHQRGLSGIDGLIAGTAGTRSVSDAKRPVVALIGDVSALHDVGSVALAARATAPLVIVVIDNGGGRIFGELPVARAVSGQALDELFTTPPGAFLEGTVRAFGLRYALATDRAGFVSALRAALEHGGATVIEARVEASHAARAALGDGITAALAREGL